MSSQNPLTRPVTLADYVTRGGTILLDAASLVEQSGLAQTDPTVGRWLRTACRHARAAAAELTDVTDDRVAASILGRTRGEIMSVEEHILDARGTCDGDLLLEALEWLRLLRYATERGIADILGGELGFGSAADSAATAAARLGAESEDEPAT